jgi:hypothetical protein
VNKRITIGKLRIRVPAAQAGDPKALAAEVAKRLAGAAGGWRSGRVDAVQTKIPAGAAAGLGLAQSIAGSVHRSMTKQGGKS